MKMMDDELAWVKGAESDEPQEAEMHPIRKKNVISVRRALDIVSGNLYSIDILIDWQM